MTPKSKEYVEDSDTDSEPEQNEAARSKPKPPSPIAKRKSNTTFNSPPKKVPDLPVKLYLYSKIYFGSLRSKFLEVYINSDSL